MAFAKHHILPFLLALAICFLLVKSGKINAYSQNQVPEIDTVIPAVTYYPYFAKDLNTELWLRSHLKNKSVVVLGSSELTAQNRKYIPNKFLTDSMHIPCIAFGKGGNQCFSIFCQLLSFNKDLPHSKVVIILSPGWFDEYADGTAAEMFLLYNNRRTLGYILGDDAIPFRFKNCIGKYVGHHLSSIDAPDENLLGFYYLHKQENPVNKIATFPFAAFHRFCWQERNAVFQKAYEKNEFPYPVDFTETGKFISSDPVNDLHFQPMNWDSLYQVELNAFKLTSSNNTSGVENEYYNTWVRNKPLKRVKEIPLAANTEYQDFLLLMDLLQYYEVNAYFIIQGLNPYAFENPGALDPTIDALEKEIAQRNYKCFNMFTSSKTAYVKGTLNDIMHTGEYGWLKIDSAIAHHYFKPFSK
jgi:D-alanine transfer protein